MKFVYRSHEQTDRQQRCAWSKARNLSKIIYKLKAIDKATFFTLAEKCVLASASTREPKESNLCLIQGRLCTRLVRKTLILLRWRPWGHRGVRRRKWRPTARCKSGNNPRKMSNNCTYSWQLCFLKKHPQFFHSGSCARIVGIFTRGRVVKNYISTEMERKLIAILRTTFHLWFLVSQRVPSSTEHSPSSPSSSSQDSEFDVYRYTKNPVPERSGSTGGGRDPQHESTETENKNNTGESGEIQRDISHELPDWLQEFRVNLVDERTSTEPWRNTKQGSRDFSMSSHELTMESRAQSGTKFG